MGSSRLIGILREKQDLRTGSVNAEFVTWSPIFQFGIEKNKKGLKSEFLFYTFCFWNRTVPLFKTVRMVSIVSLG